MTKEDRQAILLEVRRWYADHGPCSDVQRFRSALAMLDGLIDEARTVPAVEHTFAPLDDGAYMVGLLNCAVRFESRTGAAWMAHRLFAATGQWTELREGKHTSTVRHPLRRLTDELETIDPVIARGLRYQVRLRVRNGRIEGRWTGNLPVRVTLASLP